MKIDNEVSKLMLTPMKYIPEVAQKYIRYLSSIYGFCGEIAVTGFFHYCQAVLKMRTANKLYKIDKQGKKWFKENI